MDADRSVLDRVLRRVREVVDADEVPVVVLDIDSTLFLTGTRHHRILTEWATTVAEPAVHAAVAASSPDSFRWSADEPLRAAGIDHPHLLDDLHAYWSARFFTSAYGELDTPAAGAQVFVTDLVEAGGLVVYLTGRMAPQMGEGTVRLLQRWGFPLFDGRTQLVMKPSADLPDRSWKASVLQGIARLGRVVATFENEPGHANDLLAGFPQAIHVLLETAHGPGAPVLHDLVARIPDFRR